MKLAIVCCLHGNESYGLEVVKRLPVSLPFFIGNEKAFEENRRFIDVDLNRCFPGSISGNHEEKLAYSLKDKLAEFDCVIDLHSSSNDCPMFGIITNPTKENIELAKKMGLKRLVIMNKHLASGKALIDHVNCGISLEVGPRSRKENVDEALNLIDNLLLGKNYSDDIKIYEAFKIIKRKYSNAKLKNFQEIQTGDLITEFNDGKQHAEEDFTAVLVNEEAYEEVLCIAAKKIIKHHFQ